MTIGETGAKTGAESTSTTADGGGGDAKADDGNGGAGRSVDGGIAGAAIVASAEDSAAVRRARATVKKQFWLKRSNLYAKMRKAFLGEMQTVWPAT